MIFLGDFSFVRIFLKNYRVTMSTTLDTSCSENTMVLSARRGFLHACIFYTLKTSGLNLTQSGSNRNPDPGQYTTDANRVKLTQNPLSTYLTWNSGSILTLNKVNFAGLITTQLGSNRNPDPGQYTTDANRVKLTRNPWSTYLTWNSGSIFNPE